MFNFCMGVGKSEANTPGKGISPSTPGRTPVLKRNGTCNCSTLTELKYPG